MNKYSLIIFFLFLANQIHAKNIEGQIVDRNDVPLEYVNVALYALPDTTFISGSTTDKDGYFSINKLPENINMLLRVSFIGYNNVEKEILQSDLNKKLPKIILYEAFIGLNEVTITAQRPQISSKGGILTTFVHNTLLSKEHSVNDVLSKIPGIVNNQGVLEVFGSGEPIVYINNRKVQSKSEIAQLDVKNIKSIELITNPGSQYDASTNAVLKIHTLRKDEGISVQVGTGITLSEKLSHNENIRLGYANDKLSTSAYYSYYDYANKSSQYLIKEVQTDTIWQYETNRVSLPKQKIHSYNLNLDYEFSKSHIAGIQFSGTGRTSDNLAKEGNKVIVDKKDFLNFNIESVLDEVTANPQLNLFYNANWNKLLSSEFNIDFVYYNNTQKQNIDETVFGKSDLTHTDSRSTYKIYATKYVMNYKLFPKSTLVFGMDLSLIDGYGSLKTASNMLTPFEYESRENKNALFAEYDYKGEKISLNGGLRYEKVVSSYTDLFNKENDVKESYYDFYPSLRIAYSDKGVNNSLSFSVRTQRPSLSYLNSKTYYQNRFMYQQGNPLLKPQTSYILEYMFGYKFINFRTSYTRTNNYISATFLSSQDNPAVIVSTWRNFTKAEFIRANLNLQHTIKFWSPSLSIGAIKPFLSSDYKGKSFTYNKLNFYVLINNYIKLPKEYVLSVNYYFNNGGNQRIFTFKPFQSLNLGIQKSFFNNRLSVNLKANDIFRTLDYKENAEINNMRFYQNENYSEWNFSLGAVYRFNQKPLKYRGKSSAKDEINRL